MTEYQFPHSRIGFAANTVPDFARPTFSPPASQDALAALETAIGRSIPTGVRDFFATHDSIAAMNIWNGYWVGGAATLARSISRGDFPSEIESHAVMPIATDGSGNAFLLALDPEGPVWKWSPSTQSSREVAPSFQRFLDRLSDDFRMFAAGNHDWPYLSG